MKSVMINKLFLMNYCQLTLNISIGNPRLDKWNPQAFPEVKFVLEEGNEQDNRESEK